MSKVNGFMAEKNSSQIVRGAKSTHEHNCMKGNRGCPEIPCSLSFEPMTVTVRFKHNHKVVGKTTQMLSTAEIATKLQTSAYSVIAELARAGIPLHSFGNEIFISYDNLDFALKNTAVRICSLRESSLTCELTPYVDNPVHKGTDMLEATYRMLDLKDISIQSDEITIGATSALLNVDHYSKLVGVESRAVIGSTLESGYPVYTIGADMFIEAKDLAACLEN